MRPVIFSRKTVDGNEASPSIDLHRWRSPNLTSAAVKYFAGLYSLTLLVPKQIARMTEVSYYIKADFIEEQLTWLYTLILAFVASK